MVAVFCEGCCRVCVTGSVVKVSEANVYGGGAQHLQELKARNNFDKSKTEKMI